MALVKIRRRGRSLTVTLDPELLAGAGLKEGDLVSLTVDNGRIVLEPVPTGVRPEVLETVNRIIREERSLLDRLAKYDAE